MKKLIALCNACARTQYLQFYTQNRNFVSSSFLAGGGPLKIRRKDTHSKQAKVLFQSLDLKSRSLHDDTTSFSEEETRKFSDLAPGWWDVNGEMIALHSMNSVRVPFIRDCLLYQGYNKGMPFTPEPLKGVDILEVGCGGGILCEPLARLGANVVGIDSSEEAIRVAEQHRSLNLTNLQYIPALVEDMASTGTIKFDAVIASEVIEHVENQKNFVETCSSMLNPGGSLIISTINRTLLSYALAITLAEKVFKVAPDGAHDWSKFITVLELTDYLSASKLNLRKVHGLLYNPVCNDWSFIDDTDINYIVHAVKDDNDETQ